MSKDIKDWSASITGLAELGVDDTLALYSEMLATAHDIGYKVPDQELIETEDAEKLKQVIPSLHEGLTTFHAAAKAEAATKAKADAKKPKPGKAKKAVVKKAAEKDKGPTKPAKKAAQKEPAKETTMTTAPAAKKTAKKAVAKKAAAPAKKAVAKKAAGKKAAAGNARTPAATRNPFGEKAVIKVLIKENPARADSQRGQRIAVVLKYNNKKVADYYANEKPPFNRTDTLRYLIDNEYITVK